jgi:hypothetical protein
LNPVLAKLVPIGQLQERWNSDYGSGRGGSTRRNFRCGLFVSSGYPDQLRSSVAVEIPGEESFVV